MPKGAAKTKIFGLKNTRIQSLKIKGMTPKPVTVKNLR